MNVMLVQGTWGDDDGWWRRGRGSFADAVVEAGHTLINGRHFEWSTDLGGVGFGKRDLNVWRGAGRHLYDRCDPPLCPKARVTNLCLIGHSHARQVIKYACHFGLVADRVILVAGPVRRDVDADTPVARANMGRLVCLHGGQRDRMQWFGELFDGHWGIRRHDPDADLNQSFADATHSSLLVDPAQYARVLDHLR